MSDKTAPLLAQVAAMTGKTDPGEQQAALAQLQGRLAQAEAGEREAWIAVARARNVPPSAMLGWEHLPVANLKEVAQKAQGQAPAIPGELPAAAQPSNPFSPAPSSPGPLASQGQAPQLNAWDQLIYGSVGVSDPAKMQALKSAALPIAQQRANAGAPDWVQQAMGGQS